MLFIRCLSDWLTRNCAYCMYDLRMWIHAFVSSDKYVLNTTMTQNSLPCKVSAAILGYNSSLKQVRVLNFNKFIKERGQY